MDDGPLNQAEHLIAARNHLVAARAAERGDSAGEAAEAEEHWAAYRAHIQAANAMDEEGA